MTLAGGGTCLRPGASAAKRSFQILAGVRDTRFCVPVNHEAQTVGDRLSFGDLVGAETPLLQNIFHAIKGQLDMLCISGRE